MVAEGHAYRYDDNHFCFGYSIDYVCLFCDDHGRHGDVDEP